MIRIRFFTNLIAIFISLAPICVCSRMFKNSSNKILSNDEVPNLSVCLESKKAQRFFDKARENGMGLEDGSLGIFLSICLELLFVRYKSGIFVRVCNFYYVLEMDKDQQERTKGLWKEDKNF